MYPQDKRASVEHQEQQEHQVTATDRPLLVSVPEAAHLLGIGLTYGWTMVRSGQLPTVRLGRRILVPRAAIEQLAHATSAAGDAVQSSGTSDKR